MGRAPRPVLHSGDATRPRTGLRSTSDRPPPHRAPCPVLSCRPASAAATLAAGATDPEPGRRHRSRSSPRPACSVSSPATFAPQSPLTQAAARDRDQGFHPLPSRHRRPSRRPCRRRRRSRSSRASRRTRPSAASSRGSLDTPGRAIDQVDFAVDGHGVGTSRSGPVQLRARHAHARTGRTRSRSTCTSWAAAKRSRPGRYGRECIGLAALAPVGARHRDDREVVAARCDGRSAPGHAARVSSTARRPRRLRHDRAARRRPVDYLDLQRRRSRDPVGARRRRPAPPPDTGTEAVARLLVLASTIPRTRTASSSSRRRPATRAEAAWSFAQLLELALGSRRRGSNRSRASRSRRTRRGRQRLLTTAVHYVGYPYVWGGTSPTAETFDGVQSVGGFDCSGFVWRVYKLTPYAGEGDLAPCSADARPTR